MGNESIKDKKLVYHLTKIENLESIATYGLMSRRQIEEAAMTFEDVADPAILVGRSDHDLDTMVPFHFFPRNPFDYAVVRKGDREEFALLTVRRTDAKAGGWSIIPRHPLSGPPSVLKWAEGMDAIDWAQMDKEKRDYLNDRECKMVCMAEALSPSTVPTDSMSLIFVPSEAAEQAVREAIKDSGWNPSLKVNPRMFP